MAHDAHIKGGAFKTVSSVMYFRCWLRTQPKHSVLTPRTMMNFGAVSLVYSVETKLWQITLAKCSCVKFKARALALSFSA